MKVVFFSPHFPPNFYLFCRALTMEGIAALGIGDVPFGRLSPELQKWLSDYRQVYSLEDYDQVHQACAGFARRHQGIDRIDSHNEHWLYIESRIREDFDLPGLRPAQIINYRRKSFMKEKFAGLGLKVAAGKVFVRQEAALEWAGKTGFPLVAKPDRGVGGEGVHRLETAEELETFFRTHPPENYILEECIAGEICTYDGLVDQTGEVVFAATLNYCDSVMDILHHNRQTMFYVSRELPEALATMGQAILKEFEITERFFHIEFFRTAEGEFIPLEINFRPPGGWNLDMFNFAHNIDLYRAWACILRGKPFPYTADCHYYCGHISRREGWNYRYSHHEILERWGREVVLHLEVPHLFRQGMGDYAYVVRAPQRDQLFAIKDFIHQLNQE